MGKLSKKRKELLAKMTENITGFWEIPDALSFLKENSTATFDETLEVVMRLNVDPRHADQMVRGAVRLPHGTGKTKRVLVFAAGEKAQEARDAGADYIGDKEMVDKIKGGWLDFDAVIATPDMMKTIRVLGKILGPRKMMPNPKAGTLTMNIKETVEDIKKGMVEFRVDKGANVHGIVGRKSFDLEQLLENTSAFIEAIMKARPASAKGRYLRTMTLSTTMGPGLRIDPVKVMSQYK